MPVPHSDADITRLAETFNRLLDNLEQAFLSQRQIIQDVSHELKTPLTVLRGEMDIALKKARTAEEYQEILSSISEEIETLRRIVDNLLVLAALDSKGMHMEFEPVGLSRLLRSALEDVRVFAKTKKVEVGFDADGGITVNGSEAHLKRVFLNLIENAVEAFEPGSDAPVVAITTRSDAARELIVAEVADNGKGIPPSVLQKLFQPYFSTKGRGTGLGLAIVNRIVTEHHGRIHATPNQPRGAKFTIELPAGDAA